MASLRATLRRPAPPSQSNALRIAVLCSSMLPADLTSAEVTEREGVARLFASVEKRLTPQEAHTVAVWNTKAAKQSAKCREALRAAEAELFRSSLNTTRDLCQPRVSRAITKETARQALEALPIVAPWPRSSHLDVPEAWEEMVRLARAQVRFTDSTSYYYDVVPKRRSSWVTFSKRPSDARLALARDVCLHLGGHAVSVEESDAVRRSGLPFGGWLLLPALFKEHLSKMYQHLSDSANEMRWKAKNRGSVYSLLLEDSVHRLDLMQVLTNPKLFEPAGQLSLAECHYRWGLLSQERHRLGLPPPADAS